jgi:hypothetical protein
MIAGYLSFFIILGLFIYHMNQPYFFVTDIRVQGNESLSQEMITDRVEDYLNGSWLGIIPRRNIFFYQASNLQAMLENDIPKIYHSTIRNDGTDLVITIEERKAHSVWCVDTEYERIFDEECYMADQRGYWYDRAPYFSDHLIHKVYIAPEVDSIRVREQSLPEEDFEELFQFINAIEHGYGMGIERINLMRKGDVIIDIYQHRSTRFETFPEILINLNNDIDTSYRNLGIVLDQEEFTNDLQNRPQDFEAIDLRFDDRVFYRFTPQG